MTGVQSFMIQAMGSIAGNQASTANIRLEWKRVPMTQMVAYDSRESITAVQSVMMQNPGFNITKLFCARLEWKRIQVTNTVAYNST